MTDDIVQRLRAEHCDTGQCPVCPLLRAAAAEIERLRARIASARSHIEPLVKIGHESWKTPGHVMNEWVHRGTVNRVASAALAALDGEAGA